ncbi:MAG: hypothetical protein ACRD2Y_14370 [Terriglobales bacterium]
MIYQPNGFRVTLPLPLRDNGDQAFPAETWRWWKRSLLTVVDAYTHPGKVEGFWRGQTEEHLCLFFNISGENKVDEMRALVEQARGRFEQESMYFEVAQVYFEEVQ